jgi:peptidoglycan glycosyltransferase
LDEEWETLSQDDDAPLVNRATQGLYQPGAALQTVVLAEAVSVLGIDLASPAPQLAAIVEIGEIRVECLGEPEPAGSLAHAYGNACPGPITWVGEEIGLEGLSNAVDNWGLSNPPEFDLPTESGEWEPVDSVLEAIGQGSLTVSPLQMALVAATVANDGMRPIPWLVMQVEEPTGEWRLFDRPGPVQQIIPSDLALELLGSWPVYGPKVVGHLGTAVAGEERQPHAWFLGVSPADSPRYAVAVLLEHPDDPSRAAEIGTEILEAAVVR